MTRRKQGFKKILWRISIVVIGIFMLIATIFGAMALEIDQIEDKFLMSADELGIGAVVVSEYQEPLSVESDFEWVTFDKAGTLTSKNNVKGDVIISGVTSISYYVNVPKNADIGIYRSTIKIISGDGEEKYLNIKTSVQNKPISTFFNFFLDNIKTTYMITFSIIVGLILFLVILYSRLRH